MNYSKTMNSLSKKLLLSLGLFAILFNLLASSTFAQTVPAPWYAPTYGDFNKKVTGAPAEEIFGERYTQAQIYWIIYSLLNFLTGESATRCIHDLDLADPVAAAGVLTTCLNEEGLNPSATGYSTDPGSILGLAIAADSLRLTMPASGIKYLSQKVDNIIPTANAQNTTGGFGFNTLIGTQNLWGAARNMTYGLMVLIVLALAFGIMLRVKLNPQTVITIQSAIPKVVIALIAITFSFAIAGLLIDLSYLVQGIVASFIYASGIVNRDGFGVVDFITTMNNTSYGILSVGLLTIIIAILGLVAGTLTAGVPGVNIITTVASLGNAILMLLLLLAFVITLVRILWLFLRTYAVLLINIVFGPFVILGGAVNLGGGLMGWAKTIVAQLSVFVSASVLIVIAHIFIWGSGAFPWLAGGLAGRTFNAFNVVSGGASLGSANVPGVTGVNESLLGFFVGLVVLFAIPNLCNFIRDTISKPARLDLGIGEALSPSTRLGTGLWGAYRAPQQARDEAMWKNLGAAAAAGKLTPAQKDELRAIGAKRSVGGLVGGLFGQKR